MKNNFILLGSVVGLLTYIPLMIVLMRGGTQNFATWLLWAVLDGIAAGSIFLQGGNFWLPVAYTFGSIIITITLFAKKQRSWTWFESFVTFLVGICLVVWSVTSSYHATVASVVALIFASLPQIVDTWKAPIRSLIPIWSGFGLANAMSFMGGKEWSVSERLYSGTAGVLCLVLIVFSFRSNAERPAVV